MKKTIRILSLITAVLLCSAVLTACGGGSEKTNDKTTETSAKTTAKENTESKGEMTVAGKTYKVTDKVKITMQSGDEIVLCLFGEEAPITVANFTKLVKEGFYDGLTFHRVISGFMIQGGDPSGDGTGGSADIIKGEFAQNGVENSISHVRGVVSMARKSYPLDSASSQFFICHADSTFLDGSYAAFGKVESGMDTVDKIAAVDTDSSDKPLSDVVMAKVEITD